MEIPTEELAENASVPAENEGNGAPEVSLEQDSAVERDVESGDAFPGGTPTVSGEDTSPDNDDPSGGEEQSAPVADVETQDVAMADGMMVETDGERELFSRDSFPDSSNAGPESAVYEELGKIVSENRAFAAEMKDMHETLQDSLSHTQYVSARIDAVSGDMEDISKRVAGLTGMLELLAQEREAEASDVRTKNVLSKAFLLAASVVLVLLVAFQVYTFVTLLGLQRLQNASGAALLQNVGSLNKKLSDFDGKFAKTLEKTGQQEQPRQGPEVAQTVSADTPEAGSAYAVPVAEKLNRLRNGFPEKRLIRKETGDWFICGKKGNESISDAEIIKILNGAYTKLGRSLNTKSPMPPHNALCVLKPDGKGGTLVVMTDKFLP